MECALRLAKWGDSVAGVMFRLTYTGVFAVIFFVVLALDQVAGAETGRNVKLRGGLQNARIQFEQKRTGRVAFIGGSITQLSLIHI